MRWEKPLSKHDVQEIYRCIESTYELVTYHDWGFGPLVKATFKNNAASIYYCGGDEFFLEKRKRFLGCLS